MVKSPKIRHSKQRSEPVTIDLSAEDVKRDEAKSGGQGSNEKASAAAGKPATAGKEKEPAAAAKPASGAAASEKSEGIARESSGQQDRKATPDPDKPAAAASTPSSSFGRSGSGNSRSTSESPRGDGAAAAKSTEPSRRGGGIGALGAGLAGGVLALVGAGALYLGGYMPAPPAPPPPEPDNTAIERLESELASMREEIAALQSAPPPGGNAEPSAALEEANSRIDNMAVMVEDLRGELSRLSEAVAAGGGDSAALDAVQARLAEIEQTIADLPETSAGDTQAISAELSQVTEQVASLRSALDELASSTQQQFAAIDESLASLGARIDEQANEPGVALAIAASALRTAIDRGQPFTNELETFAQLAPNAPEIDALREYAAKGVPTPAAIAAEADSAARRMIEAGGPDNPQAGLFERLWASAESLVTVRPIGDVEGDDVPAIVARIEAAVRNGDYAGAIAEYETLPDDAKAAGAEFIAKVKARQAADELVGKVLAEALRA